MPYACGLRLQHQKVSEMPERSQTVGQAATRLGHVPGRSHQDPAPGQRRQCRSALGQVHPDLEHDAVQRPASGKTIHHLPTGHLQMLRAQEQLVLPMNNKMSNRPNFLSLTLSSNSSCIIVLNAITCDG